MIKENKNKINMEQIRYKDNDLGPYKIIGTSE